MEDFKRVFEIYGHFIDCFQEELYEELTDYIAYRELSAEEPPKEQERETVTSSSMLDALSTAPKRFVNVRKLHCQ